MSFVKKKNIIGKFFINKNVLENEAILFGALRGALPSRMGQHFIRACRKRGDRGFKFPSNQGNNCATLRHKYSKNCSLSLPIRSYFLQPYVNTTTLLPSTESVNKLKVALSSFSSFSSSVVRKKCLHNMRHLHHLTGNYLSC